MSYLQPLERASIYNKRFPTHPPMSANERWLVGFWYLWRSKASKIYGGYPTGYLKRFYTLFPDCPNILHLFSGALKEDEQGIRFDISPEFSPDILGDVVDLIDLIGDRRFDIVFADPPYEDKDFEIYGFPQFNKGQVVRNLYHVVKPDGFLVWLDLLIPMYKKKEWLLTGMIGVAVGTNMRTRTACIFKRQD